MPKRSKPRKRDEEIEHIRKKMRKLKQKMQDLGSEFSHSSDDGLENRDMYKLGAGDWLTEAPEEDEIPSVIGIDDISYQPPPDDDPPTTDAPSVLQDTLVPVESNTPVQSDIELDSDILEILGEDPSRGERQGKNIHEQLASRLKFIATEGLNKDTRKELIEKYPLPGNCTIIGAPKLNPEIKVAVLDNIIKRDKGIENKQSQMANAISCLAEIITSQISSKNKDKETLTKLIDLSRLLCDIQHGDSVTRRNFILFSLKKELKEHLNTTKIDFLLFGEALAETLKTAKSINKSGGELKADPPAKNLPKRPRSSVHLNRRAPGAAYRQPGPSRRNYEPAALRPLPPLQPPAHSSRQWPRPQLPPPPPPPPPPPAHTMGRRRY